jgi:tetratricopeptide (TPR) repeat protein
VSEFDEEPTESELAKQDKIDIAVLDLAERADALLRIAQRKGSEPDDHAESLTYADAAVSINRTLGREPELFRSLVAKCDALYATDQFDECVETCQEALVVAENRHNEADLAFMFFNLSGAYFAQGDFALAIVMAQTSAKHYETLGSDLPQSRSLWSAGVASMSNEDFELALKLFTKSLALSDGKGEVHRVAELCHQIADALIALERFAEAEPFAERAEATLILMAPNQLPQKIKFDKARIWANTNRAPAAIGEFEALLAELRAESNVNQAALVRFELAKAQFKVGHTDEAIAGFKALALTFSTLKGTVDPVDAYFQLALVYCQLENDLDQEWALAHARDLAQTKERTQMVNTLNLQIALLVAARHDNARALSLLEAIPRSSWAVASESWVDQTVGLMNAYAANGRFSEVIFVAKEIIECLDHEDFKPQIIDALEQKTKALVALGEHDFAKREAQTAFDLLMATDDFARAQQVRKQYLAPEHMLAHKEASATEGMLHELPTQF